MSGAENILSEYSNNRNSLMSKLVLLDRGQFEQFSVHSQMSIVSIFRREYIGEKGDLPVNSVCVGKSVRPSLFCASAKMTSLSGAEKILSEYSNNRNSLISKTVLLEKGQFWQVSAHSRISVVSIFSCEYLGEKGDLPANPVSV